MKRFRQKYIGDKQFYLYVLAIAVPMIIQNMVTNFVSMLDNIMVGQVGTAQMSGVSIVNQFIFVFNLTVFGGLSGASIFGTQFFGKNDRDGQRYTVRFRLILAIIVTAVGASVMRIFGTDLISLFLSDGDDPVIVNATLQYGKEYLNIMIWGLIPFAIGQAYASVVRECGETKIPMYGSLSAIGVNLFLDYALIFGKFGLPEMGVKGAAIATVVAKCIEALVIIVWAHTHKEKNPYIVGLYKSLYIPGRLTSRMIIKGCPLLVNEFLWSLGMSLVAQCYSTRGLEVVAARNIASTVTNLFNVVYIQLGATIGIIVGARLGAGKLKEARDIDNKLVFFSTVLPFAVSIIMFPIAKFFPQIYNTETSIKELASFYILIQAFAMPIWAYTNSCYFTLRCGGKTGITFLFDFVFTWFVMLPTAYVLAHFTSVDVHMLFVIVTFSELIKVVAGYFMIRSDIWINNLVADQ